jgi:23S rRNA (pseudouridine1915-N3)-methyltransferase
MLTREVAMRFEVCAVGTLTSSPMAEAAGDYRDRIERYVPIDIVEVDPGKGGPDARKRDEATRLSRAASEAGANVALDEGGRLITSETLADWIDDQMVGGVRYVSFLIGGAHGLDDDVREDASWSLSLSPMTLPHQLARVVLLEQLYRAMTIIRGEPYHKG